MPRKQLSLALLAVFTFFVRYRGTALGSLWLLLGPALFIGLLGFLYAEIGGTDPAAFIPRLAVGLVTWSLIAGLLTGSSTVFQRGRTNILQGSLSLDDIVLVEVTGHVLAFLHQLIIVAAVLLLFRVSVPLSAVISVIGIGFIIANGYWLAQVLGTLGARYRDLAEVVQAAVRIAFLATPILWVPGTGGRSQLMGAYLAVNPFHHFIEVVRAPLLGQPVAALSWGVVLATTLVVFLLARLMTARFARFVPLWV